MGVVHEYTGRGPTRARTSIRDDVVVVMLQETMLKAERSLIEDGKAELVAEMRRSFQQTMRKDMSAAVAELTGREVVAFMSDSHLEPDYSVEVFVLAPERASGLESATAARSPRPAGDTPSHVPRGRGRLCASRSRTVVTLDDPRPHRVPSTGSRIRRPCGSTCLSTSRPNPWWRSPASSTSRARPRSATRCAGWTPAARLVTLDLRALTFMDVAGVHAVADARSLARATGRRLHDPRRPAARARGCSS